MKYVRATTRGPLACTFAYEMDLGAQSVCTLVQPGKNGRAPSSPDSSGYSAKLRMPTGRVKMRSRLARTRIRR